MLPINEDGHIQFKDLNSLEECTKLFFFVLNFLILLRDIVKYEPTFIFKCRILLLNLHLNIGRTTVFLFSPGICVFKNCVNIYFTLNFISLQKCIYCCLVH